jgi:hypothetical protein
LRVREETSEVGCKKEEEEEIIIYKSSTTRMQQCHSLLSFGCRYYTKAQAERKNKFLCQQTFNLIL